MSINQYHINDINLFDLPESVFMHIINNIHSLRDMNRVKIRMKKNAINDYIKTKNINIDKYEDGERYSDIQVNDIITKYEKYPWWNNSISSYIKELRTLPSETKEDVCMLFNYLYYKIIDNIPVIYHKDIKDLIQAILENIIRPKVKLASILTWLIETGNNFYSLLRYRALLSSYDLFNQTKEIHSSIMGCYLFFKSLSVDDISVFNNLVHIKSITTGYPIETIKGIIDKYKNNPYEFNSVTPQVDVNINTDIEIDINNDNPIISNDDNLDINDLFQDQISKLTPYIITQYIGGNENDIEYNIPENSIAQLLADDKNKISKIYNIDNNGYIILNHDNNLYLLFNKKSDQSTINGISIKPGKDGVRSLLLIENTKDYNYDVIEPDMSDIE